MTQITDTVYRADGSKAKGTVLISWPAFTTQGQGVVAAGSLNVALGPEGAFSAKLAATTGSNPTGVYYRVVYQLEGETAKEEYWAVPVTDTTTISAVRAKLVPTNVAAQFMTRDLADSAYVKSDGDQTVKGLKTFAQAPSVPDPQKGTDAANKAYVDANAGTANLGSPPPIGTVAPNAINATTLTAQLVNGVASADAQAGNDCGAKINAASGVTTGQITVSQACGTTIATAVTVAANQVLKFVSCGTWTVQQPITLLSQASLVGLPKGTNGACVKLKQADGANLPYLVHMTGDRSVLKDVYLDGNYAKNPTAQDVVWVDNANRVVLDGAEAHFAKRYGTYVTGLSSCCGRILNKSFLADNYNSNLYFSGPTTQPGPADWMIGGGSEFENSVTGWGIEAYNAATLRANNIDIGGNGAGGIKVSVTGSGVSNVWQLNTVQFGNNHGHDFYCDGSPGSSPYQASNHVLTGLVFYGLAVGTVGNTYDSIHLHDCGGVTISGNYFAGGGAQAYRYHYFSDQTRGALASIVSGNSFNAGGAASGDLHGQTVDTYGPNSGPGGGIPVQNQVLANNAPLLVQDETGAYWGGILGYRGSLYVTGDPNANSSGKRTILFQPNGNGSTTVGLYGNGTGSGGDVRIANGSPLQWLDHAGTQHTALLTDGGDHSYIMGNLANDLIFQPTPGTTECVMTAAGQNCSHGFQVAGNTVLDAARNATVNNLTAAGDVTVRSIAGHEYFVSKYASIQAAIDAAYNNGAVQGGAMVVDDRLTAYTGAGWIVRDSVTLKLAAVTYSINATVQYNNGVKNVTAGIIVMPGSHMVGVGTSANHGTNVNAANGLNADLIATSTVGSGTGQNAQWWHWGSLENFHMDGNKSHQTAGHCINVENMGETAVLRALEAGNCYADDLHLEGNFATQSEISNITVNSAGQYGVNLNNFQGVGVLRGLSGDSNATSIIRFNGNQSATLTVLGLKSEEEIAGHDPLITIDMMNDGSQPAFYLVGGYTYGRTGLKDVVKIVNGKTGAAPFVQVSNFYVDANFTNAVNDTVNGRTFAAANMNKVPFSYLPTGAYMSGQAFTFAPGTYIQAGTTALTEVFGSNTDSSTMIAAQGNGDGTSYFTGGLKFGIPNRAQYGSTPEMMARMGSRFLGAGQGYDTNTWVFVPIWKTGDSSNRWIGEPNQRWPEVYAADVNTTTATVGTLTVSNCNGCNASAGMKLLNYQVNTGTLVGNGTDQAIYTYTIPAGTMQGGTGVHCWLKAQRVSGSGAISYKWKFGGTTVSYAAVTSGSSAISTEMEVFDNPGSTTAQIINLGELHAGNSILAGAVLNQTAAENTTNAVGVSVTFNGLNTEQIKGVTFKCVGEE